MAIQKHKQILLLGLLIIPGLILARVVWLKTTTPRLPPRQPQQVSSLSDLRKESVAIGFGSTAELAPWQGEGFVQPDSPEAASHVSKCVQQAQGALSPEQQQTLSDIVGRFLQTYMTGAFDDYFNFKTQGVKYEMDFAGRGSADLIKSFGLVESQLPSDPKLKVQEIWQRLAAISGTNNTCPRLAAIQPEKTAIFITTNSTGKSDLLARALKVSTMYPNFAPNSLIKYQESPEGVLKKEGRLLVALFQTDAHFSTTDTATPIYATFYWSNSAGRWLPWELAKYRASRFTVMF